MVNDALLVLLITTFIVAAIHTLSPDHWFGFVMLGHTRKWGTPKTLTVAGIAGTGTWAPRLSSASLQYGREPPWPITSPRLPRLQPEGR